MLFMTRPCRPAAVFACLLVPLLLAPAVFAEGWESVAPLPMPRAALMAAESNGELFVFGGWTSSGPRSPLSYATDIYDPIADTWRSGAPMPRGRVLGSAASHNGVVYVLGGSTTDGEWLTVDAYDVVTDSWSTVAPLGRSRTARPTVGAIDGLIYVSGGAGAIETPVEVYNPETDAWHTLPENAEPRYYGGGAALDGVLYLVGGFTNTPFQPVMDSFTPATGEWRSLTDIPEAIAAHAVGAGAGAVFAAGGVPDPSAARAYYPRNDAWLSLPDLPTSRAVAAGAFVDGMFYVVSGADADNPGELSSAVERYDPVFHLEAQVRPSMCSPVAFSSRPSLPVIIPGTAEVAVADIDVASLRVGGVEVAAAHIVDIASPSDGECKCEALRPDGLDDLMLRFRPSRRVTEGGSPLSRVVYDAVCSGGKFLDSVLEHDAGDDVGEELRSVQRPPSFLSRERELEDHRQARHSTPATLGLGRAQSHRRECRLDRIRRAQVDPVLGGEVVERQQGVTIFVEARRRRRVLSAEGLEEEIERLAGVLPRRGHPDVVQHRFRLGLDALRHLVQHVGCLVDPAALRFRVAG